MLPVSHSHSHSHSHSFEKREITNHKSETKTDARVEVKIKRECNVINFNNSIGICGLSFSETAAVSVVHPSEDIPCLPAYLDAPGKR